MRFRRKDIPPSAHYSRGKHKKEIRMTMKFRTFIEQVKIYSGRPRKLIREDEGRKPSPLRIGHRIPEVSFIL